MNSRIEKALKTVGFEIRHDEEYGQVLENFTLRDAEKFAELIVQKCAQRCEKIALEYHVLETTYAAGKKAGAFECAADLKKYFGVK